MEPKYRIKAGPGHDAHVTTDKNVDVVMDTLQKSRHIVKPCTREEVQSTLNTSGECLSKSVVIWSTDGGSLEALRRSQFWNGKGKYLLNGIRQGLLVVVDLLRTDSYIMDCELS